MGQWEIVKAIHDRDAATREDVIRETGLSPGAVDAGLRKVLKKNYIEKLENGDQYSSAISDEKLEEIRPRTVSELLDSDE